MKRNNHLTGTIGVFKRQDQNHYKLGSFLSSTCNFTFNVKISIIAKFVNEHLMLGRHLHSDIQNAADLSPR